MQQCDVIDENKNDEDVEAYYGKSSFSKAAVKNSRKSKSKSRGKSGDKQQGPKSERKQNRYASSRMRKRTSRNRPSFVTGQQLSPPKFNTGNAMKSASNEVRNLHQAFYRTEQAGDLAVQLQEDEEAQKVAQDPSKPSRCTTIERDELLE